MLDHRIDLGENLRFADTFFDERFRSACDTFVERVGEDLPTGDVGQFDYEPPEVTQVDLATEGIGTVLFGYSTLIGDRVYERRYQVIPPCR